MVPRSSCVILILCTLFLLVVMANAQPAGSPCYEPMDLDIGDDLLSDIMGAIGNDQLGQIVSAAFRTGNLTVAKTMETTSPSQSYVDPFEFLQPPPGGKRAISGVSVAADAAYDTQSSLPGHSTNAPTYAAVVRGSSPRLQQKIPAAQRPSAPQTFQQGPSPSQPASASYPPSMRPLSPLKRTMTYAEVLRSPSTDLDAWFGGFANALNQVGAALEPGAPAGFAQSDAPPLSSAITSNRNYRPNVTDGFQSLDDWVAQSRNRLLPPLDTRNPNHHTPSTHLSPASIASPSPSRVSSRRTKQQIRTGTHGHRCRTCNAGFDSRADLTHHLRTHKPDDERKHVCNSCCSRFLYPKDLKRHLAVHAPKNIFCPYEGCKHQTKGFSRPDHMERHVRTKHAVDSAVQSERPSSSALG